MNAYFQLEMTPEGTNLMIHKETDGGQHLDLNELADYLTKKGITFDIADLNNKIALKEDKTVVKELSDRVDALEAGLEEEVHDRIQILSKVDSMDLSRIPNTKPVSIEINHLTYLENDGTFNVNREDKKITWLFNEANEGFDIDETLTDFVFVNYYSDKVVEPEEPEEPEAGE